MDIVQYGLYNISDTYFVDFKDISNDFSYNKNENRPNYLSYQDDGIIWFIPMSSQVTKYKSKIESDEEKYGEGNCIFYYTGNIAGKEKVFLIGKMFPLTEKYIKKPYTIGNTHYILKNSTDVHNIHKRVSKYISLVKNNKIKPQINIMK